jgi:tetratricopeptide (TPR) repeat protein
VSRDARHDRALLDALKSEVELARSHTAGIIETLEVASRLFPDPNTLESLAYAYWKLGNPDDAARKYEELTEKPLLGNESQEEWVLAHYHLGKIFQQAGDLDKARQYYQKLLDIWKAGDPDLTAVVDAKRQLVGLSRP